MLLSWKAHVVNRKKCQHNGGHTQIHTSFTITLTSNGNLQSPLSLKMLGLDFGRKLRNHANSIYHSVNLPQNRPVRFRIFVSCSTLPTHKWENPVNPVRRSMVLSYLTYLKKEKSKKNVYLRYSTFASLHLHSFLVCTTWCTDRLMQACYLV